MPLAINWKQFSLGLTALLLGILFYVLARPPGQTYFVSKLGLELSLSKSLPAFVFSLTSSLPTFIHVFAFILLTASLLAPSTRNHISICLFWLLVDLAFELGQRYGARLSAMVPGWFAGIPFIENTGNYFRYGSFDWFDMGSIVLGTVLAYAVLQITQKEVEK